MSTRSFSLSFLAIAIVVAALVSHYSSGLPDGLEYVAESSGFLSTAGDSFTSSWPLADYSVAGVENGRVSGGLAGILGAMLTFVFVAALARRRRA